MLRGLLVSRLLVSLAADDGLDALARGVHNSWVLELSPDPEQAAHWPNRRRNRAARARGALGPLGRRAARHAARD